MKIELNVSCAYENKHFLKRLYIYVEAATQTDGKENYIKMWRREGFNSVILYAINSIQLSY